MAHTHKLRDLDPGRPFTHCVAEPPQTTCDPVAHGGISFLQECTGCGMHRVVNANAGHREYGAWYRVPGSAEGKVKVSHDFDEPMRLEE